MCVGGGGIRTRGGSNFSCIKTVADSAEFKKGGSKNKWPKKRGKNKQRRKKDSAIISCKRYSADIYWGVNNNFTRCAPLGFQSSYIKPIFTSYWSSLKTEEEEEVLELSKICLALCLYQNKASLSGTNNWPGCALGDITKGYYLACGVYYISCKNQVRSSHLIPQPVESF